MRPGSKDRVKKEFDEVLLEVRRVTRVTTGGRKMSFRATILVGNKKGKIGIGVAKGPDVQAAVSKASREAYKTMFIVPITGNQTVPYLTTTKYKACVIKLLPATAGTGLKAGSSVRAVLELAGFENVLSKIMGSNNKLNNAMATIIALSTYKHAEHFNKRLVTKVRHETTDEKAEHLKEVSSAVKEIQAKQQEVAVENKSVEVKVEKKVEKKAAPKKAPAKK
ncbi:MAG: 30S ribosomal protein S5 [candidate division SR1 bacterium]|nr:30S ribosomal protein S5 [candidate division SR1 bacterium]